jgi:hypothetical protein
MVPKKEAKHAKRDREEGTLLGTDYVHIIKNELNAIPLDPA